MQDALKFVTQLEGLDIFHVPKKGTFITQKLFRLLEENEMMLDFGQGSFWDVGYYGGEASSKLKQQLIEQDRFDEAFEE